MNVSEATDVMARIQALWPSMRLPDATVQVWSMELMEFEQGVAMTAVTELARTKTYPPSLAEILDLCDEERYETSLKLTAYNPLPADDGMAFADWYRTQAPELKDKARRAFPRLVAEVERETA